MNPKTLLSTMSRRLGKEPTDPIEKVRWQSDIAVARKLEAARKAEGPEVAALAAAEVAVEAEKAAAEAEVRAKLARAAAKSASKRAKHYKKEATKSAGQASSSEVDAAAKAAELTRIIQTAALEEAKAIVNKQEMP